MRIFLKTRLMKYFLLAFLMFSGLLSVDAQQKTIFHDKDAEIRKVGDFHAIEVSSAIDLQLSQGENSVAVSASEQEHRDGIKTVVSSGVLKIWFEEKKWFRGGGKKLRAYVSVRDLDRLSASGACDITVNGELKADEMAIALSGASDFKGRVNAGSLKFRISGASDVVISGSVGDLSVDASGASHFRGYDLEAENCRVEASGASDLKITVNKVLNAKASGATNIDYKGTGMIGEIRTSGASNIRKRS